MPKVGLKVTLAMLAKGYTKKEIDALAAIDEEQENKDPEPEEKKDPEPEKKDPEPEEKKDPEPDYKKMYEDLLKENQEKDAQIKEIQKENVNENSLPDLEKQYEEETNSLNEAFKSFF